MPPRARHSPAERPPVAGGGWIHAHRAALRLRAARRDCRDCDTGAERWARTVTRPRGGAVSRRADGARADGSGDTFDDDRAAFPAFTRRPAGVRLSRWQREWRTHARDR